MKEPDHEILHMISEGALGAPIYDRRSVDLSLGIHGLASTRRLGEESYKYLVGESKVEKLTNINTE